MRTLLGILLIIVFVGTSIADPLPHWDFETTEDLGMWVPNSHLGGVAIAEGAVEADAVGTDPYFHCQNLTIPTNPEQFVVIRIRADRPGNADLFWSGETEGVYGGLTEAKKNSFSIRGTGSWEEIPIFPFWHTEGTIRQFRLDLYEGAHFAIDSIRIEKWSGKAPIEPSTWVWKFNGDLSPWRIHPNSDLFFAPPVKASTKDRDWVTIQMKSDIEGVAAVVWATGSKQGLQSEEFEVQGDGQLRSYPVRLKDLAAWGDPLLAFGLRLPSASAEKISLESVEVGKEPKGPAEFVLPYFGFENAPNRAGSTCRILAHLSNVGAGTASVDTLDLQTPKELEILNPPHLKKNLPVGFQETFPLFWEVRSKVPGDFPVRIEVQGEGGPRSATAILTFSPALNLPAANEVPEPKPIETSLDVCAYYFPGWESRKKWDCIREDFPIRKPMLGYYEEENPECVDWQIKWAVENGINCFLVDWYWVKGEQHLTHWFDAYKKARYRDFLDVAIMWANHNPPGSHSREDWRAVTQHWIDEYFPLEKYYRIEGQPAVFLWDPRLIRTDLGSSEEVRAAFEESQQMARKAGYPGIRFVAMHDHDSKPQAERLLSEGYFAATNYHEWGQAPQLAVSPTQMEYAELVRTASETWQKRDLDCGNLTYYPVVDTGWDARPWHGNKSQVIRGRTPERFERLLQEAKSYCEEHKKPFVVVSPVNEWGEGSYIEPCTEFGFEMLERIRKVFAVSPPTEWPVNLAPSDVGMGPYDYPPAKD